MADRNIEALTDPLYIGSGSNRAVIGTDGRITHEGTAVSWDDVRAPLYGARLSSNQGTVDTDWDEGAVNFQQNGDITDQNDRVMLSFQMPHNALDGSPFNFHIHWMQENSDVKQFTVEYRVQSNGQAKTTSWTQVIVNATGGANLFPYSSGTINQITELFSLDTTGFGLSAQMQVRITRSDSTGGDCLATYLDAHYQLDSSGSTLEYVK